MSGKEKTFSKCLVTGGAGMLGCEIARRLVAQGKAVRVLDLHSGGDENVENLVGDIRDAAAVKKACAGMDVVFHAAAAVWNTKTSPRVYEEVNVGGTLNVINACRENGVSSLVYTSTMDVVVDRARPIVDGDENLPYPKKMPSDHYSRTKIIAEKEVLSANSATLASCALRPAGIYGPRDRYHLLNLIRAAEGGMKIKLGSGRARFSHVYSENAAHAHVLAARRLFPGSPLAGQCYFITDHHPATNLFTFMEPFLSGLGYPVPRMSIPYCAAYVLAWITEAVNPASNFNRFAVIQTCVDHTFVHHRAKRDFGYRPVVSLDESIARTVAWFRENGYARNAKN